MSLSSNYLDAFLEVARAKSFSAAAKKLNITQSALSQRVLNLEQDLGSTLFIREASGIRLTDLGHRLLRYCQTKESLESEFLGDLKSVSDKRIKGVLRVAGFSTLNRSVLLPVLSDFLKDHPEVQIEMKNAELRDIPGMLSSGRADFVFSTQSVERQGIENHLLGYEEYVLVQSTAKSGRENVLLDHDEEDLTTHDFFKAQGKKAPLYRRSYLDEIYSIIDGVRFGMGRAVIPLHLAESSKGIEVVGGYKSLKVPVYLSYYFQSFYTDLQKAALRLLTTEMPKHF